MWYRALGRVAFMENTNLHVCWIFNSLNNSIIISHVRFVIFEFMSLYASIHTTWPACTPLKRKYRPFEEIFSTGCIESCHFDNLRSSQQWKFHSNDNISISVRPWPIRQTWIGTSWMVSHIHWSQHGVDAGQPRFPTGVLIDWLSSNTLL